MDAMNTNRQARFRLLMPVLALAAMAQSTLARAQMVTGEAMQNFGPAFGLQLGQREYAYSVTFLKSSVPGGILYPGERSSFSFQLQNNLDQPLKTTAKVDLIGYGTRGIAGDIWKPDVFTIGAPIAMPIEIDMAAKGFQNVTVTPDVPARLGGYALVFDLGAQGRQFGTSFVRTFQANPQHLQFPSMSLDYISDDVLRRLGIQAIRFGMDYIPTDDPQYQNWRARLDDQMKRLRDNNITVLLMVGTGHRAQPLGRGRPHLDKDGVMLGGKDDLAWLPEKDKDFQKVVADVASRWGWPRGPVTAFSLWNEPWEGLSISGWGADMIRYREMFRAMAHGVEQARREAKVDVLLAGADSSSNTFDKFFADGKDDYLKWLDAVTIHYQGLSSPSTYKKWLNRKSPRGRVKVWDTESWVANTDDRLAAVVAANRAAGYDRAMGIYGGNIATPEPHDRGRQIFTAAGKREQVTVQPHVWSPAASVGAVQHFIGERPFREILFKKGLPWVMVFDGPKSRPDDGTVVVIGDLGEAFGVDNVLFRTVRGLQEVRHEDALRAQMMALPPSSPQRADLQKQIDKAEVLSGGSLSLPANGGLYSLYDFYGNRVAAQNNRIRVPLDNRGFFVRASGAKGSFARLVNALKTARIEGYEPLETIAHDMTAPIAAKPALRLTLTNILNRPLKGALSLKVGDLKVQAPKYFGFAPHETKVVTARITGGQAVAENAYPLSLTFDAGRDGKAVHRETMRVNFIERRTIKVDGKLDEWKGAIAQPVTPGEANRTLTEAAWFPFRPFDAGVPKGFATGYTAYDAKYFYFAAKIADATPHVGTVRFATRNDDAYFYPQTSFEYDKDKTLLKSDGKVETVAADDKRWLQLPSGGRSGAFWQNAPKSLAFGIDLKLPSDRLHQVAVYLGADKLHPNGIDVQLLNAQSGALLDKQFINKLWGGTYLVFNAAGAVRLRLKANGDWYNAKIFGVFVDAMRSEPRATSDPEAHFVKWDYDTAGNWQGVYGRNGHLIVGSAPTLAPGLSITVPQEIVKKEYQWPQGVRRYSYRTWPTIPGSFADTYDAVQIAFNAIPVEQEDMLPNPPGTPKYFTDYKSSDYEYQMHRVAPQYGGGTEIYRLLVPGMPRKHFYPRQPKSPFDGPAKGAKLAVVHEGNTRIVEAAIPWSEIPHVHQLMRARKPVKFAFLVAHDDGGAQVETGRERSVAKRSGLSFHVDWGGHWTNEVEFGWGR